MTDDGHRAKLRGCILFSILQSMVLLTLTNGTPVIAKRILEQSFALLLDAGLRFFDGRPLLGPLKTICGILLSVFVTTVSALLIGLDLTVGVIAASTAMAGDLFSPSLYARPLGAICSSPCCRAPLAA